MRVASPCFLRETHYINYCMLQHALGARSTTARNSMRWINYCMPQHVLGSGSCGRAPSLAGSPCWCCGGWELAGQWQVASSCLLRKIASSSLFKVIGRKGVTVSRTTSQSFWLRLSSRVARACSHRAPLSFQPLLIVCCN